jgi:hypothetical protein
MTQKSMKICVLNLSGNVGKTTLATHLLAAFRPGVKYIPVESVNNSEAANIDSLDVSDEIKASRFREIYRDVMMNDDIIIDVGASNVAEFMDELTKYRSAIGEFDLIMVPTVPADKQQKDTIATIEWLSKLRIDSEKVRVVFNQHSGDDKIAHTYAHIVGYAETDGKKKACWLPHVVVSKNDVFELIKGTKKTVSELAGDTND